MHQVAAILVLAGLTTASAFDLSKYTQKPLQNVQVGVRPYFLVDDMEDGHLKTKLESCSEGPFKKTDFVFSHRGAPLQFPEHTVQSYKAAIRQGAGVIECDVTFTKDKQLICRHSQCDLAMTTNILEKPELVAKCTKQFTPFNGTNSASATCCASDITLAEYKTLCGKMDGFNPSATSAAQYMKGTPPFRTDLYSTCGTLITHREYIELVNSYGLKFTPEIKTPTVKMPFEGNFTQEQYAQKVIDDYKSASIDPSRVFFQSKLLDDMLYLITNEPDFAKQAIYLDEHVFSPAGYANAIASIPSLAARGIKIMGPPLFALIKLDSSNKTIIPSEYANAVKEAGMSSIPWSIDRSGSLSNGGDFFYLSVNSIIKRDGDMYNILDVLARQVGIKAVFSDWPATVVYYANCFGL
jgi:glycerophosphoryl diester phosphodiesterase